MSNTVYSAGQPVFNLKPSETLLRASGIPAKKAYQYRLIGIKQDNGPSIRFLTAAEDQEPIASVYEVYQENDSKPKYLSEVNEGIAEERLLGLYQVFHDVDGHLILRKVKRTDIEEDFTTQAAFIEYWDVEQFYTFFGVSGVTSLLAQQLRNLYPAFSDPNGINLQLRLRERIEFERYKRHILFKRIGKEWWLLFQIITVLILLLGIVGLVVFGIVLLVL